MALIRLGVCITGVYGAFLLWAIAQERLSKPFPAVHTPHPPSATGGDKFPLPLFFNFCQALASATCAAIYLLFGGWRSGQLAREGVTGVLGISTLLSAFQSAPALNGKTNGHVELKRANGTAEKVNGAAKVNGGANGNGAAVPKLPWYQSLPALLLQVSLCQTTAGPIGFLALRHISYPTMVLGKSCKLIPVLLLNVLLYRRRFGAHKYLVVALVTLGISMFMLFGEKKAKGKGGDSMWGLGMLLVNLFIDGLTNSTQDQIFSLHKGFSGQQMMFIMATMSLIVLTPAMLIPLPSHPWSIFSPSRIAHLPHTLSPPVLLTSIRFVLAHPTSLSPLAAYAALGGLGQIFIFETIAHFGSLTLVMVTVTRKLFTMLLSVFVFGHELTPGQWAGVAVVFAGIGVEAGFKRREVAKRAKLDKSE